VVRGKEQRKEQEDLLMKATEDARRYIRHGNGRKTSKTSARSEQMSRQTKLSSVDKLDQAKIRTRCEALDGGQRPERAPELGKRRVEEPEVRWVAAPWVNHRLFPKASSQGQVIMTICRNI
jgi:hypothetical protein